MYNSDYRPVTHIYEAKDSTHLVALLENTPYDFAVLGNIGVPSPDGKP